MAYLPAFLWKRTQKNVDNFFKKMIHISQQGSTFGLHLAKADAKKAAFAAFSKASTGGMQR